MILSIGYYFSDGTIWEKFIQRFRFRQSMASETNPCNPVYQNCLNVPDATGTNCYCDFSVDSLLYIVHVFAYKELYLCRVGNIDYNSALRTVTHSILWNGNGSN